VAALVVLLLWLRSLIFVKRRRKLLLSGSLILKAKEMFTIKSFQ